MSGRGSRAPGAPGAPEMRDDRTAESASGMGQDDRREGERLRSGHDEHDGHHEHDDHHHDHPHGGWRHTLSHVFTPHSHDAADSIDDALQASDQGIRAVKISLGVLAATALAQLAVVALTGSVALLADTVHNVADALTAIPLWIAFVLGRRARRAGTPTATGAPRIWPGCSSSR